MTIHCRGTRHHHLFLSRRAALRALAKIRKAMSRGSNDRIIEFSSVEGTAIYSTLELEAARIVDEVEFSRLMTPIANAAEKARTAARPAPGPHA